MPQTRLHSLIPTKQEEVHPLARREYHSLRRIHVKVSSGKDERGKNRNEETFSRVNKQFRASNAIRDREQERIVVIVSRERGENFSLL